MASSRLIQKKGTSENITSAKKTNLVVQYSPNSESSNPTVVNTELLYLARKSSSKISELSGQLLYMLFHVFTLCTSTYFASTSHVVEHVAQVKNLQHIQQATSRLLLLYFTSQKGDMQLHRQDLFEKAQVKASRQQITNLAVHYPQIRSCWNQLLYIQNLPYLARRLYIPNCCISPGNIQNSCISPEVTPRQNCASSPFEPWDIVGAVQST